MLRLKANKTSLYKLVRFYEPMPLMRRVQFIEARAPRRPDHCLVWTDGHGRSCKASLGPHGGKPLLTITRMEPDGEEASRNTRVLELSDLLERGMVEEYHARMARAYCLHEDIKNPPDRLEDPPGGR